MVSGHDRAMSKSPKVSRVFSWCVRDGVSGIEEKINGRNWIFQDFVFEEIVNAKNKKGQDQDKDA